MKARKTPQDELRTASSNSPSKYTPHPKTRKPAPKEKEDAVTQQQREETETQESDTASGADDESEDKEDATSLKTQKQALKKPDTVTQQQQGEAESDSRDESEEELASKAAAAIKSEATKASRPLVIAVTAVTAGEKKRANDTEQNPAKRVKKDKEFGKKPEDKKKLFERTWSEEDEIALLEGVCEFTEKNGINPSKDMNAFYNFIKTSLHIDVKLIQLKDKVSRLKKRFDNNLANGKKGKDKTFSKPHEQKLFDFSKKIWGSAAIISSGGGVESNVRDRKISFNQKANNKMSAPIKAHLGVDTGDKEDDKAGEMKIVEVTRSLGRKSFQEMAEYIGKKVLDVVDEERKEQMEEKWNELHVKEIDIFLQQIELVENYTNLVLTSYKGN